MTTGSVRVLRYALIAAAASLFVTFATAARAGDSAQINVIGYSPDGRIFAYEEWGIQDGSGFAYSNYHFIDLAEDAILPETPIRVRAEEELQLGKTRATARQRADALIRRHALEENAAYVVLHNPVSETGSDPHRVSFSRFPVSPPLAGTYTLELVEKAFPASKACLNMTGDHTGFDLAFREEAGRQADRLVHEDRHVPASRGCPNGYRIGAVVTGQSGPASMVAMIVVSQFGFEGNDERWIAVPLAAAGP